MRNVMDMINGLMGRGYGPRHSKPSGYRTIRRLNRSQHWKPAKSYAHARAMSPYPERPVK